MKITQQTIHKNMIKAIRFETPDFIPMNFVINDACWQHYPQEALFDLMEAHPFLFPDFKRPAGIFVPDFAPVALRDTPYKDSFGCVWTTSEDGITGTVTGHPLADWNAYASWQRPNADTTDGLYPMDWETRLNEMRSSHKKGEIVSAGLRHGHTFLQLCDIRGYENLLFDMMDEEPMLDRLISDVEQFNLSIVQKCIAAGADIFYYPEDLGMQNGPMLSPDQFRKYIKPSYQRLMKPARDAGVLVHMHSDGDIRTLVDDIIDGGVDCINLQDLVNGIGWIADRFTGKTCVDLDIDRQKITPYGTPSDIDALIQEEVRAIGTKQGGLTMVYGLYPGVPLENVNALMDAMEKYAFYYN